MTSNVGSEQIGREAMGFAAGHKTGQKEQTLDLLAALRERFRPEFLNRVDRICAFRTLDEKILAQIVDLQIKELNQRLAHKNIQINISPDVRDWLVEHGTHLEHGARALRRTIQEHLESQIASFLLNESPNQIRQLSFVMEDKKPRLEKNKKASKARS